MILITGAAGKTGKAILNTLTRRGIRVRALVRSQQQKEALKRMGVNEVMIGDLRNAEDLQQAMQGIRKVYYICPNIAPDEVAIGQSLIDLAKKAEVTRFVYHSVLHPQVEAMPHHWQKMRMEEKLFESGLSFSILQPCAYMQNLLQNWKSIIDEGIYAVPYATSARISIVDLEDISEVAANVLTQQNHKNAIYELAGPQPLSQDEVAETYVTALQKPVKAVTLNRDAWAAKAAEAGTSAFQIDVLVKMFEYYEKYGLIGNPWVLTTLLDRPPVNFATFVSRQIRAYSKY
ncbi:MAG TPA: NmrA family NAD(P)-binding protein [Anaerolineaceae bacterium]|nr:NmrA family NAD(P)-binding protein [Anaerolineaceae bacterium]